MTTLKNIAVAVASIVIFSNITHAQALKASYSTSSSYEEPLKVKYIGEDNGYLLFQVTLQSPTSSLFAINDKSEGELYSSYSSENFKVQTVKIEKREAQVLNFKLVSGKKVYNKSFSVNTNKVETTTVAENNISML